MTKVPVYGPAAVGVKVTFSVSEPLAATVAGSVMAPTVNGVFPVLICEMVALTLPVFVITRFWVLLVPAVMLPNESTFVPICNVADGAGVADPLSKTC